MPHPEMKAIGPAFGPFTNFSRRISIHRAATLGPKCSPQQVIIKNTEAPRYSHTASSSSNIMRSQSHMSSNNVQTLAPRRSERIKLEASLADVWTRHVLPYPAIGSRRTENPIRASANSVMRKLSMASITSNFSKRSLSYSTLSFQKEKASVNLEPRVSLGATTEDGYTSSSGTSSRTVRPKKQGEKPEQRKRPVLVDFHNAPDAFLPEDFELNIKGTNTARRSRKLAARLSLSMTAESRPQSTVLKTENLARPVVIKKADTVRSMAALMLDGAMDSSDDSHEAEAIPETSSGTALEAQDEEVPSRPSTPLGGLPMRQVARARKGLLRIFG